MVSLPRLKRAKIIFKIWKIGGNPWKHFCRLVLGGVDTCLVHPHPPTHLYLLLRHPLPRKASRKEGGSRREKRGSRYQP